MLGKWLAEKLHRVSPRTRQACKLLQIICFANLHVCFGMLKHVVHTCTKCNAKYSGSREETSRLAQEAGLCQSCYGVCARSTSQSIYIDPCVADARRDDDMAEIERTRQSRTSPQQKKSKSKRHIEQWTAELNSSKRSAPASSGRATKQATTKKLKKTAIARKKIPRLP